MSNSIQDVKIDSTSYFIKSFKLSTRPTSINGINYFELNNSSESYFQLSGYLRYSNNIVFIVPKGYENDSFKEYKLFDFNAKKNSSWKMLNRITDGKQWGDSVIFLNKGIDSLKDTLYHFSLIPFFTRKNISQYLYDVPVFNLEVSKRNGIVDIKESNIESHAVDYQLKLFPKEIFIKIKHPYRSI